MTEAGSVTVRAPAKVNLSLSVGAPGADGFHPVATVFHAISLFDHVTAAPGPDGDVVLDVVADADAEPADGGDGDNSADMADSVDVVPRDDRNLAVRAARLLAEHTGIRAGVRLTLRKAIPVAGGLAGGSTDAAAALVACDALWQTRLPLADLQRLAARLGSDVAFCLVGGTAIGEGRGERLSPALARGTFHWVVAVADAGLSTARVYAEADRMRAGCDVPLPTVPVTLMDALRRGTPEDLGPALCNDLQPAALALRPDLAQVLDLGRACGALGSVVSGSGPTCVFLANDDAHALDISVGLASAGACREVHLATGPVPGAQVVST